MTKRKLLGGTIDATTGKIKIVTICHLHSLRTINSYPGLIRRADLSKRVLLLAESKFLKLLPTDPRCVWCNAPFQGPGAPFMRAIGKGQSQLNPSICSDCESFAIINQGGAEVEAALLFADIRGSTSIAEKASP